MQGARSLDISHTSNKQSKTKKGSMFGFESLEQRRQGEYVHKRMEEPGVYDGKCIRSVHYRRQLH